MDFQQKRSVYVVPEGVFLYGCGAPACTLQLNRHKGTLRVSDRDVYQEEEGWTYIRSATGGTKKKDALEKFNDISSSSPESYRFFATPIPILLDDAILYCFSSLAAHWDSVSKVKLSLSTHLRSEFILSVPPSNGGSSSSSSSTPIYERFEVNCASTSKIDFRGNSVNHFAFISDDRGSIANLNVTQEISSTRASHGIILQNICIPRSANVSVPAYIASQLREEGGEYRVAMEEERPQVSTQYAEAYKAQREEIDRALQSEVITQDTYDSMAAEMDVDFSVRRLEAQIGINLCPDIPTSSRILLLEPVGTGASTRNELEARQGRAPMYDGAQRRQMNPMEVLSLFMHASAAVNTGTMGAEQFPMPDWTPAPPEKQGHAPRIATLVDKLSPSQYDKKSILGSLDTCIACMTSTPSMACHEGHVSMCRECTIENMKQGTLTCNSCNVQAAFVELKYPKSEDMKCSSCRVNFRSTACSTAGCMMLCTECVNSRIDSKDYSCPHCANISRYLVIYPQGMKEEEEANE